MRMPTLIATHYTLWSVGQGLTRSHSCRNVDRRLEVLYEAIQIFKNVGSWKTRERDSGVFLQRKQCRPRASWVRTESDSSGRHTRITGSGPLPPPVPRSTPEEK